MKHETRHTDHHLTLRDTFTRISSIGGCSSGDGGAAGITHAVPETVTVTPVPRAATDLELGGTQEGLSAAHQKQVEAPGTTDPGEMYVAALSANGYLT